MEVDWKEAWKYWNGLLSGSTTPSVGYNRAMATFISNECLFALSVHQSRRLGLDPVVELSKLNKPIKHPQSRLRYLGYPEGKFLSALYCVNLFKFLNTEQAQPESALTWKELWKTLPILINFPVQRLGKMLSDRTWQSVP